MDFLCVQFQFTTKQSVFFNTSNYSLRGDLKLDRGNIIVDIELQLVKNIKTY